MPPAFLPGPLAIIFPVNVCDLIERFFWLPGQLWMGGSLLILIGFHQAVARHIQVVERVRIIRITGTDKSKHKSALHVFGPEDVQQIDQIAGLDSLRPENISA